MTRRVVAPLSVAARRIAARPGSVLLTGFGIALATAALTTLLVGQVVVEDRAVSDAIGRLPADERMLSVSWVGIGTTGWTRLDREAQSGLRALDVGEPLRAVGFRSTRFGTDIVRLAAVDDVTGLLELRSGRLPTTCGGERCELVALDADSQPLAAPGLSVTGSVTGTTGAPLAALVGSTTTAERVFVGVGVEELARRPEVSGLFRTLTWAVPLNLAALDSPKAAELPTRIAELDTRLRQVDPAFAVHAPLHDLAEARDRATSASRRQLLVGGQCVVVFLAFAVLAASRIRRNAGETRFRLRRLRALRWQIALETAGYAVLVALPAVLVGCAAGLLAGAVVADAAGRPTGDALRRALTSAGSGWALALLAVGAVVVLIATTRAATLEIRGRGITPVDVAAAAVLAAIVAAFLFGETDAESLSRDGEVGAPLLLLPVLVALAGALLAARGFPAVLRLAERPAAAAGVSLRLALLSLVRNPGVAAVAVACLTATIGMAVFALTYRATLAANQRDAASYAAPLDYVVAPDPTRGRFAGRTADLAPTYGRRALGVIRRDGEAPTLNRSAELTVLGLPADAFERMRWRGDYASSSLEELGESVAYRGGGLRGVALPVEGRELVLPRTVRGDPIRISAQVRRPDGGFSVLDLTGEGDAVSAPISPAVRGGTLVGLTLAFPPIAEFTAAHRATGSRAAPDVFLRGLLTLGQPRVRTPGGSRALAVDYSDWVSSEGAGTGGSRAQARIRYFLTQERTFRIRPSQPTDDEAIPAIASESLVASAGSARVLPVRIGRVSVDVRIVETARRFPTLSGDFVVADREALATAANAGAPGVAVADEAWLSGRPDAEAELGRRAPFPVRVTSRAEVERSLRADPVSRAASLALLAATIVAGLIVLAGLVLALAVDARDDAADLFDLESLGFDPARLARHLWLRSAVILGAGLIGGLVTGALASLLVTDLVAVTANATPAEPPLVPALPWGLLAVGLIAFGAVALGIVALLARRPFRGPAPARPEAA
ncbi:MAG TPA: ABC transporter permease [Gaiellaceae bacterium]|nr:ABC transporter permease [Gaiellaceae bacterium]